VAVEESISAEVYYQKAGVTLSVMLSELVPQEGQQTDLFAFSASSNKSGG
jgi:DNA polymerase V